MRTSSGFADGVMQPDGFVWVDQVLVAAACMISCDGYLREGRAGIDILPGNGVVCRYWVSFIISLPGLSMRALLAMDFAGCDLPS